MWPNPQETADLGTFTEETPNGKLHFLWSVKYKLGYHVFSYWKSKIDTLDKVCSKQTLNTSE